MTFMQRFQKEREDLIARYGDNFEQPAGISFGLNVAEAQCVTDWLESLKPEIMAAQRAHDPLSQDEPYYGATGGGVTYSFIPTGLGTVLVVKEAITGKELNVSDALHWHFYG